MEILQEEKLSGSTCKVVLGDCDEIRVVVLKFLNGFMNSENNGQKWEVDVSEITCQTIKSGAPLITDGKENWLLKHSQSENEVMKTSGSEQLPYISTVTRNASSPLVTSDDKTCCRNIVEPLLEDCPTCGPITQDISPFC